MSQDAYKAGFLKRTQQAREVAGYSVAEMAQLLGIPLNTYKKYEQRSPLPHALVQRFCTVTGCSSWFLFTGEVKRDPR